MVYRPNHQYYISNLMLLSVSLEYANISKYIITKQVINMKVNNSKTCIKQPNWILLYN